MKTLPVGKLLTTGLLTGTVVGLLGAGASMVVVPSLTYWVCLPEHEAHGTCSLVALPAALISMSLYAFRGYVNWRLAVILGAGGAVGAYLGTRLMPHLSPLLLRRVFATTALIAGWQMLRR